MTASDTVLSTRHSTQGAGSTQATILAPYTDTDGSQVGSRVSGFQDTVEAAGRMTPVLLGLLAAGVVLLLGRWLPYDGVRNLAAIIGTTGWIYIWLAFDNGEKRKAVVSLVTTVAVYGSAFMAMKGGSIWLVAGFTVHVLWGALHLRGPAESSPGPAMTKAWIAFNASLAAAVIFVIP